MSEIVNVAQNGHPEFCSILKNINITKKMILAERCPPMTWNCAINKIWFMSFMAL